MRHLLLSLALLSAAPLSLPAETRPPVSTVAIQLSSGLPNIGDFALLDTKGEVFALGRILVDFGSVYDVLAKEQMAKGACEFVFVPISGGKRGMYGVHQMRYWIDFEHSVVQLNTDMEGSEVRLEFPFDPSKEFTEGVVRKGLGDSGAQAGTCRIRIKDAPLPEAKPAPAPAK